ncbi:unnamed protein product [Kuraishia capsulata CBS 1993]|uniref:Major facilitator superfamily (MFS) profile domain-containing protein n=1 Tax=Kuraishia capsulata CBS 1993 TaxID=1382522 RepID=W6MR34_9ASCO|nr:uncharacterized protein KUCA_T00005181001 [Kuraishia capsulata CBS 1993]CDK29194.1 unnamed protein product [Kuraishia capsulata CBS 1993]
MSVELKEHRSSTADISTTSEGLPISNIIPKNDEDDASMLMAFNNAKPSLLVICLTVLASISGFMFGYDTGYISSALVSIGKDFGSELTYGQQEFITAATSLGALISAIFAGICADLFGRKPVVMTSNVLFVVGAAIQCGAHTVWTMIAGRLVMGFGVGIGSLIAPLYISELAPSRFRGRLVVINCLGITGGQLIAYGVGAGLDQVHNGWRVVVGLSMIPPAIQLVAFFFLPETPRYLISKGKTEKAAGVISRTHPGASQALIETKIGEFMQLNNELPGSNVFSRTWEGIKEIHRVPSNFRALVIACALQGIQQFTGFNSLMYFSSTIFQAIGFDNSTAVSVIVAGTNFVFTLVAFFVIDRVGRRRILLIGIPGMMISLIVCAISFHYIKIEFKDGSAVLRDTKITGWGIVVIVGMVCFVATYAVGIGNVPWQQCELFPQSVRGIGASYATATNWSGSLVISATFLTMLENITPTGTFAFFAGLCLVAYVFVFFCYPELSNMELEETQAVLTGGFNIKQSKKLASARRRQHAKELAEYLEKNTEELVDKV